jgi:serine/threonine protein kinase
LHGVAHRDIKPENILITEFPLVKLGDFGLCGYISPERLLVATFCGSPSYCAPECLRDAPYDGNLSDVWSLGVLLYLMVTGEMPWDVENAGQMQRQIVAAEYRRIHADVGKDCLDLIARLLRPRPEERIKIDQVCTHHWLGMSEFALALFPEELEMKWRELRKIEQSYIATSIARQRSEKITEWGIVSPFAPEADEGGTAGRLETNAMEMTTERPVSPAVRIAAAPIAMGGKFRVRRNVAPKRQSMQTFA